MAEKDIASAASKLFVMSALLRIGADVTLTLGDKKKFDITVNKDGKALTIDVKGLQSTGDFILGNHENTFQDKNHFFIFVYYKDFKSVSTMPEFFVVPAVEISELINERSCVNNISLKRLRESYGDGENSFKIFLSQGNK